MRATLTFNLDNPDDAMAHLRCVKSLDMALSLWEMSGKIRTIIDTSEDGKYIDADLIWNAWEEIMGKYDINFNKILD